MIRVLCNGCFDVLHIGHIEHLEEARSFGDYLIVSLTLDDYVNKVPGLPVNCWEHRARMLEALRCVDRVVPSRHCWEAIREFKPDIFVKGIDYLDSPLLDESRKACKEVGAEQAKKPIPKYHVEARHIDGQAIHEQRLNIDNHATHNLRNLLPVERREFVELIIY